MKLPIRFLFAGVLGLLLAGGMAGCSKQGGSGQKVDLQQSLAALKSEDKNARGDAAIAIAGLGEKGAEAVPALIEVLKDPEPEVRRLAAYALMSIGKPAASALPAVKELLKDPSRDVVQQAVITVRALDPNAAGLKMDAVTQ